jgi:membrane associated rhomboid family serine protease
MAFGERQYGSFGGGSGLGIGLPPLTPAVRVLLIANVAVFVLQIIPAVDRGLVNWLAVSVGTFWQPWRYVTFQFLHADFIHIAGNMLGLYLLGTPLEREWGSRRFTWFYLSCGVAAGVAYVLIGAAFGLPHHWPIIGASGGVYGVVLASAVLFPHFQIILLFFPVPIRLAAIIIFAGMLYVVAGAFSHGDTHGAMSDVAHLGGAACAAGWIWLLPRLQAARAESGRGSWRRRQRREAAGQEAIDHILAKISRTGIGSLSWMERRVLRRASQSQRHEEKTLRRM